MNDKIENAIQNFNEGFNCSQVIFREYAEQFGLDKSIASKIACSLGGGIAGTGQICGVLTGAYLVLGLKHGNSDCRDQESKKKTYELVKEFTKKFENLNGSTVCNDLKGQDRSVCVKYIKDALEILQGL
jgi:C_GCAxxG_C_C family probable redox protein